MPTWTKEQQEAIETSGTNIIVSAGAGSGKTAVLTHRVINKLQNNIHINELLILTFTKAAADEMKERIRSSIKKEVSLKNELEYLDSSYITTFDSFSLSVVKKYHYKLNIPHDIGITDSTIIAMKKKEIINNVFDSYYEQNDPNFTKLIYDFCVKDDKELKKNILQIANKIELLTGKEQFLDTYLEKHYDEKYIKTLLTEYEQLLNEKKDDIFEELENFYYIVSSDYFNKVSASLETLRISKNLEELMNIQISIPPLPRNSEEEVKEAKERLKKKTDEFTHFQIYGNTNEIKDNILLTKNIATIIVDILKKYFKELDNYKVTNNIYDFQDIAILAINLLKNNDDVCEELKKSFKEIMIDEYQDTNDIQEEFISLISNNNVYMVGDIKQSIYRFRNANPSIFKNKYDNYSQNNGGIKIDLLKNFRSREEVLTNINTIFNYIMDDLIGGADYIKTHQMVYGNIAYNEEGKTKEDYNMEFLEYDKDKRFTKDEIEIFAIGRDIQNKILNKYQVFDKDTKKLHDATYSDFVILMDRSTKFDLFKKVFEYLGIPLTICKDEKLNEGYDLYIIKSLIDILICIHNKDFDTKFKYDFISIARSYLYNISDNEIFAYFLNNNFNTSQIFLDLEPLANDIDNLTTYQILTELINKTNLYDNLTTTEEITNSMVKITKLLESSKSLGSIGYDIYSFNTYIETLIEDKYEMKYSVDSSDNNAVKIMTIHKSKGLEYNICYFCGLDKEFNIKDIKEKFTYSNKYGIITPFFKEGIRETIIKELLKDNYYKEEISEKIRLLYVALTRAKEKMIFILPSNDYTNVYKNEYGVIKNSTRKRYRSFLDIILSIKKELNSYIKKIDVESLNISNDYLFAKESIFASSSKEELNVEELNINESTINSKSFSKKLHEPITQNQHNNIELGLLMHETLELLDFYNPNYNLIKDNFVKIKVQKFLNDQLLANVKNAKVYKEYEFMYQKEDELLHGIIDLMLEYEDHIDIIDYKLSNILDDNYLQQLNGYKEYISTISNKQVNLYLFSMIGEYFKKIS
ncbi:MAG: UvrD-helicase domain-containing protein [Bacilli bacterium]